MTFGWTIEAQIAAARLRSAICEIPVNERRRIAGQQKVSGVTWQRTLSDRLPDRRRWSSHPANFPAGAAVTEAGLRASREQPVTPGVKWWLLLAAALTSGCGIARQTALAQVCDRQPRRSRQTEDEKWTATRSPGGRDLFWPDEKIRGE